MKVLKPIFTYIFLILLAGALRAQSADTVVVPANMEDGTPYFDSIIDYVVGDTTETGQQKHKIYRLERGKFYILNQAITLRNPVELMAYPPVENDAEKTPPKIMSNINEDGSTSTGNLIITFADITVKNIWLSGIDYGAVNHGWGEDGALWVQDSLVTVNLDGIWCDYNSWSAFGSSQPHTRWHINNFHARNEQNDGDQWTTFLFYLEGSTVIDTFIVTNSSYFQSNSCFLFPPKVVKYLEVNHCTFVNSYKWPFHQTQWLTAKFTNNIFYNEGALGLTPAEAESQDPDGLMFGLINTDTLAIHSAGGDTLAPSPYTIPENQRVVEVKNNLWFYSSEIDSYITDVDSVMHPIFMNSRTEAMFADKTTWPGFDAENNWNQDPMFNDFSDLSATVGLLAQACRDIRAGTTHGWQWESDQVTEPDYYKLFIQYPTVENFRSYTDLKGTDGNPLGDLTYYPADMVGVDESNTTAPVTFELKQNYPNPFNPSTTIEYSIPESGHFMLKVYNTIGQEVATLVNGEVNAGFHKVSFKANNLASGLYIYRLTGNNINLVKKMMLLK
ncbi:MAG: T9SS type A sorting domain-containing protein [Ignavibacteriaceae bacterium]